MTNPFIGEIKLIPWDYAPTGWAFCDGTLLSIDQNQSLYTLLGKTFGGDGATTFGLPDLRGRTGIHISADVSLGTSGGEATHQLSVAESPEHTHVMNAANVTGNVGSIAPGEWLGGFDSGYGPPVSSSETTLAPLTIGPAGGGAAHENRQPYLCLNYVIALTGSFPSS